MIKIKNKVIKVRKMKVLNLNSKIIMYAKRKINENFIKFHNDCLLLSIILVVSLVKVEMELFLMPALF